MPRLVLASSSPYRRAMLLEAGLAVETRPPEVDESAFEDPDPQARAVAIAVAKARATRLQPGEIGIAADQVIVDPDSGELFGKPANPRSHVARLLSLRGKPHHLYTGFCVWNAERRIEGCERAEVWIRSDLNRAEVASYVATGDGSNCAGGYTAEGKGSFMIERVVGDWFTVIGLPLYRVHSAIRELRRG